jgi:hypothetical protein
MYLLLPFWNFIQKEEPRSICEIFYSYYEFLYLLCSRSTESLSMVQIFPFSASRYLSLHQYHRVQRPTNINKTGPVIWFRTGENIIRNTFQHKKYDETNLSHISFSPPAQSHELYQIVRPAFINWWAFTI